MSSKAEIEALLDEGYTEGEAAGELGMTFREVALLLRPKKPQTTRGARKGSATQQEAIEGLLDTISGLTAKEVVLPPSIDIFDDGEHKAAPDLASLVHLSRSEKISRLAQAMAWLRNLDWLELEPARQRSFLELARFAVRALEYVEADQVAIAKGGGNAKRGTRRKARA